MMEQKEQQRRRIHVLLVDDDRSFARLVEHHLRQFQGREFSLTWKETVEDALDYLEHREPTDIILTDLAFPGSNGLDFCLQMNQREIDIPVVFVTAMRDYRVAVEALKLGVEDFLLKEDLSESLLPRTIANAFERAQRRRQMAMVEKRMLIAQKRAEAIRELVVTVCHEFNNPLAAIKISADLLVRQQLSADSLKMLETLDANFRKIEAEIKRLRDINFEQIDLHESIAEGELPPP
jgi:FixJ family two-component response regulator